MNLDHRRDGFKNIAEDLRKFSDATAKSRGRTYLGKELFLGHQSRLIPEEQGRVVDEFLYSRGIEITTRGDFARHDAVIKINQDLAQIKNNNLRWRHNVDYCGATNGRSLTSHAF